MNQLSEAPELEPVFLKSEPSEIQTSILGRLMALLIQSRARLEPHLGLG